MCRKTGKGLRKIWKGWIWAVVLILPMVFSCQKKPKQDRSEVGESLNAHGLYKTSEGAKRPRQVRTEWRAYPGAPPRIPHQLGTAVALAECLNCHHVGSQHGPNVLHENQTQCLQCHVPIKSNGVFIKNEFRPEWPAGLSSRSWPLSPPFIPHRLQDRQDCRVCHTLPGSKEELRPQHGDLPQCRQCHIQLQKGADPFLRRPF